MLSVVLPCFNESENVPIVVRELEKLLKGRKDVEIIVVDGGSTDDTPEVLKKCFAELDAEQFRLILMEKRGGYGHDINEALKTARGDVLAWTHADLQTSPDDVLKALALYEDATKAGHRVIVKGKRKNRRLAEAFFTFGMQCVAWAVLRVVLDDINAQPKLFSRDFYEKYIRDGAPSDFSIDLFLLYEAKRAGYAILELPVFFAKRQFGEAKGGGGFKTRIKLIQRTFRYIFELRKRLKKA